MSVQSVVTLICAFVLFWSANSTATYRGQYVNQEYGFEVTIPPDYTGLGAAEGAPNHGFVIKLDGASSVVVDAMYDTIVDSSGRGFDQQMRQSNGPPKATLDGLKAWVTTKLIKGGNRTTYYKGIVARRSSNEGEAIIYTISESADAQNRASTDRLYKHIVSSFRVIPIH